MNKTAIEWCDMTWNPVTGCKHGCEYCYAARMSNRFGLSFEPAIHRERLKEPCLKKQPQNIFVCSMADLFGEWVPDNWIQEVFKACEKAPWHRYLFLTKNPKRYEQYIDRYMPKNMLFGWTQTKPCRLEFKTHHAWQTFLSLEPMQAEFRIPNPHFDWLIIGAETGNRKDKVIPKKEWIEVLVNACRWNNIPVFMKNSLISIWGEPLIQQYPWERG
jgi:protein gp37